MDTPQFRTLFLSDLHLGSRNTRTQELLEFLPTVEFNELYLVGDIIDGWSLERSSYWPDEHQAVVDWILARACAGRRVYYIPGNHDEFARRFLGTRIAALEIVKDAVHVTAAGKRYLVTHGDEFDGILRLAPWISRLGAGLYGGLLSLNKLLNAVRASMGKEYWSLSAALKLKTKRALQFVADFRESVANRALQIGANGVICGHIHHPESRYFSGIHYVNTGDWVESCSALAECHDGTLVLLFPVQDDLRQLALTTEAPSESEMPTPAAP